MNFDIISISVTVALALLGYLITYWNNIQIAKRKEQLELVNSRICEFYGPLYIATQTGHMAFLGLSNKLDVREGNLSTSEEWRIWVKNVFMPNNEFIEKLILEKAYLIQEKEMPTCLLDFVVHVAGYKVVVIKWENGDFSESLSVIEFPVEIEDYAMKSYQQLKNKQLELIGKSRLNSKIKREYSV